MLFMVEVLKGGFGLTFFVSENATGGIVSDGWEANKQPIDNKCVRPIHGFDQCRPQSHARLVASYLLTQEPAGRRCLEALELSIDCSQSFGFLAEGC
jgi:hypothetical protein